MQFDIIKDGISAELLVEDSAFEGVKKIADVVADDIESVCKNRPYISASVEECTSSRVIIFATIGRSEILNKLYGSELVDIKLIADKKESFFISQIDFSALDPERTGQVILVAGSDKRGTIYGMFKISEACGVTSLAYFGDCDPKENDNVMLTSSFLKKDKSLKERVTDVFVSKVPSVEYRGFFINDEWPAFGGWSRDRFGGFTSECYKHIFIFLLRMRGNFLWPAMWSSIFSQDGPGIENAKLADCLGVIMGTSHHEPLCRAGEEWQKIYRNYGESNSWNFINNKEAITEFWRDGLNRNKKFENLYTIGMRGEADSKLLGEDATMADNINVVKDAIITQHKLLKECIGDDLKEIPRVLAIYKEVEDYYYGDETCEGLKDWEELKDVIFLLSDDNWANTRGLPTEDERLHPGGYGMYYHFDYHGGPISYEWQNTSRLTKTWEQMTQAYEYGVRKEWIVNVGDLKGNEYPLTYFMALAYDYETWSRPNMTDAFLDEWLDIHFHGDLDEDEKNKMKKLIEGVTRLNALRKPESLSPGIYDPVSFGETKRMMSFANELLDIAEELRATLKDGVLEAYKSLFYYQFVGSLNILLMTLEAGLNEYLSKNRSLAANEYADSIKERSGFMGKLIQEYNAWRGGKWVHMLESGHTGLRTWDDHDWGYPVSSYVNPIHKPKIFAYIVGDRNYSLGSHWQFGKPIVNRFMTDGNINELTVRLESRGDVDFTYEVTVDKDWLTASCDTKTVRIVDKPYAEIRLTCDKNKLSGCEQADVDIKVCFENKDETELKFCIIADRIPEAGYDAFYESNGIICIEAAHFNESISKDMSEGFRIIKHLGRMGDAVKCFPVTKDYRNDPQAPYLRYDVIASEDGIYNIEVDILSRNPVVTGDDMILYVSAGETDKVALNAVEDDFYAGHTCPQWCEGVLDNVRRITSKLELRKGKNSICIQAGSPNVSFDKLILWREEIDLPYSYLGPMESYRA